MHRCNKQIFFPRRHTDSQQLHEKVLNITKHQGNANQNNDITSHLFEWLLSKRQETMSVGKDVEKGGPLCSTDGGNVNRHSHYVKQY